MNYKIEGNINFYGELQNKIDNDKDNDKDDNSVCLITNTKLEDNYITLECKHKFNYLPLFTELCQQKKYNNLEITNLAINEIKCPYCREITPYILPFVPLNSWPLLRRGVNCPNKYCMKIHDCEWKPKSGKKKGIICGKTAYKEHDKILCVHHHRLSKRVYPSVNKDIIVDETWTDKHRAINNKYLVRELKQLLADHKLTTIGIKRVLVYRVIDYNIL